MPVVLNLHKYDPKKIADTEWCPRTQTPPMHGFYIVLLLPLNEVVGKPYRQFAVLWWSDKEHGYGWRYGDYAGEWMVAAWHKAGHTAFWDLVLAVDHTTSALKTPWHELDYDLWWAELTKQYAKVLQEKKAALIFQSLGIGKKKVLGD